MNLQGRATIYHQLAFWLGTTFIVTGVCFHLPDFIAARGMHYRMSCMPMSELMLYGMGLIVTGIAMTAYGLFPVRNKQAINRSAEYQLHTMDNARLNWAHWQLVIVLTLALVVDVMKPATLGFVMPGMREEYGITASTASLLALSAMIGTTAGSVLWGILADRFGRRGSILLAALIFISTCICGTMPTFHWNLFMCFVMGLSAGGLLPIVFALLAEMTPARQRGWLSVLMGGLGTAGGYLAASGAAAWLEPIFSWRILWLLNLPTGLLVILLSRRIPESPRFLLHEGKVEEAKHNLAKFGIELVPASEAAQHETVNHATEFKQLFRKPYVVLTLTVGFYGVAWGLVNWGFLTWLPFIMRDYLHLDGRIANHLLAKSALFAVPGCVLVAWLYGFWSSRRTMVLFAVGTAGVLASFATFKPGGSQVLFSVLTVLLLIGLSGMIAMLSPYSVELYPTKLRASGGGVTASSSKVGGVVGPSAVALIMTAFPGLAIPALSLAVPLLLAATALWMNGKETSGKRLEELHEKPRTMEPSG
ncbi:MAG TPA: MFS transporter [Verrucomicrobiae bacterium]|nr:MFS transporter [Verrucomicrobiae bacterium]